MVKGVFATIGKRHIKKTLLWLRAKQYIKYKYYLLPSQYQHTQYIQVA